jgi:hypothetical protein
VGEGPLGEGLLGEGLLGEEPPTEQVTEEHLRTGLERASGGACHVHRLPRSQQRMGLDTVS